MLIQDIQTQNYEWDDPLSEELADQWASIQNDLSLALKKDIPRLILPQGKEVEHELHVFSDASIRAFAAVAYIRSVCGNSVHVHLICAKSRIVQPNLYTIPKLELRGIVLATRLVKLCRSALQITLKKQVIWSGSECALAWVLNDKKILPVFVNNRVKRIRRCENVVFRFVPGILNPADLPTRGLTFTESEGSFWWSGPNFLQSPPSQWPNDLQLSEIDIMEPEIQPTIYQASIPTYVPPFGINCTWYNDFTGVIRITATIIRFLRKITNRNHHPRLYLVDNPTHFAEILWLKAEQQFHYNNVIRDLSADRISRTIKKFGLYLDEFGLIRCAHRLRNANLPQGSKFPILLPRSKESHFTKLLVIHFHKLVYHQGTAYTLTALKKEFWLPRGRATVSSIVRTCQQCKRFTTRPFPQPDNSQLPSFHLTTECYPFLFIGIDTFGTLMVGWHKYYSLEIVDLVCRAVDLEVIEDMMTEELMFAWRRFVARRIQPNFVVSDNAPQFLNF